MPPLRSVIVFLFILAWGCASVSASSIFDPIDTSATRPGFQSFTGTIPDAFSINISYKPATINRLNTFNDFSRGSNQFLTSFNNSGYGSMALSGIGTGFSPAVRPDQQFGSLHVITSPQGALILVDGWSVGFSPVTVSGITPGTHRIDTYLAGYLPLSREISVGGMGTITVEMALVPVVSSINNNSVIPEGLPAIDAAIMKYTNFERSVSGLSTLSWDEDLAKIAIRNSENMRTRQYFSHFDPDGHDLAWRLENADYSFDAAGENIAFSAVPPADADPDEVGRHLVQLWMDSPEHRENILSPYYTRIGTGTVYEPDPNRLPRGYISTQLFSG
jgi:uncharacterized protein YkwD